MNELSGYSHGDGASLLTWQLQQTGAPLHKLTAQRPDFLIISPPKTGSTWLAANLRRHPKVFVPEVKEVKYFSSFFKALDVGWYLDHFEPGAGRVKGEASPCYALLPVERIRLIRRLMPNVKLVYLMRAPIARAWSHAKHNHRYGEANFASHPTPLESVSDEQWRTNFLHDWALASGDYLGQLRRWLSVFPDEQIYVGYYESIVHRPAALLGEVFAFLGVDPDVDLSAFPLWERILPGPTKDLPSRLGSFLRPLFHDRTRELAAFLRERFQLEQPPEWQAIPDAADGPSPRLPAFRRELDDGYLEGVLEQAHAFRSAHRLIVEDHLGYRIVFWRGRLYALAGASGLVHPAEVEAAARKHSSGDGDWFVASTLAEVKERVARYVSDRDRARLQSLEVDLQGAREQLSRLAELLGETVPAVRRLEGEVIHVSAKELALVQAFRNGVRFLLRGWRRFLASFA